MGYFGILSTIVAMCLFSIAIGGEYSLSKILSKSLCKNDTLRLSQILSDTFSQSLLEQNEYTLKFKNGGNGINSVITVQKKNTFIPLQKVTLHSLIDPGSRKVITISTHGTQTPATISITHKDIHCSLVLSLRGRNSIHC